MLFIDQICYLSKLRFINPMEKFAFSIVTMVLVIVGKSISMSAFVLLINSLIMILGAGIDRKKYTKLLAVPFGFLLVSTLAIIINISGHPLDLFAVKIGGFYITAGKDGLIFAIKLMMTAISAVSCLYFLSLNTTMTDILYVLRKLRVPAIICELMMLIYRFVFLLMELAYNIGNSQAARLGNKDFRTSLKSYGLLVQSVFIKSIKRSNATYNSMEARCYDGEIRTVEEFQEMSFRNIGLVAIFDLFLLMWVIAAKLGYFKVVYFM